MGPSTSMTRSQARARGPRVRLTRALLCLLILAYVAFFSAYTLQRHATLNTFAADLSYIDQPMWNTLHGRFLERTLDDRQVPRVAEHLELILLPFSLLFLVWNDVRAILILQTAALALGALPVFWIGREVLGRGRAGSPGPASQGTATPWIEWVALAFAAAYLLFPALQAANVADFHADPFVVAPLLFAFWCAMRRRYRGMWIWAAVAMASKENLSTLTAMLGLYVLAGDDGLRVAWQTAGPWRSRLRAVRRGGAVHGLALVILSLAWFYVATFLIVAPLARQVYGTPGPIYLAERYAGLDGGVSGLLRGLAVLLRERARVEYLLGLAGSASWLALLAPEYLLLGAPVLVANTLSSFPGQFSGEQHYSAPLVPVIIIAAIFGARRLLGWLTTSFSGRISRRASNATLFGAAIGVWLLAWSLGAQVQRGWTPLARPFDWPERTAHHQLLERFTRQIPADAAVSATPAVHPHLAHREKIYLFPIVSDAAYVLVDVAGDTGMHPNDVPATLERLIRSGGFGIQDAADGYVLLSRQAAETSWPDAFFDFARARGRQPQYPLDVTFGGKLRLLGYDVVDDRRWRLTRLRFYWLTTEPLPAGAGISMQVSTPWGAAVDDTASRPMPALLWYPPDRWQPGETIVTEGVPWFLPRAWAPVLSVSAQGTLLAPQVGPGAAGSRPAAGAADGRVRLPGWERRGGRLVPFDGPSDPSQPAEAAFRGDGWSVRLTSWAAPLAGAPGRSLPVTLRWQLAGAALLDYTVFVHLRDQTGRTVATGDGQPAWFLPQPTSQASDGADEIWDAHAVNLPVDLPEGRYDLVVGWYDRETGARLALAGSAGNGSGNEIVLGPVTIDAAAARQPDVCCLMVPECCASQE